MNKRRLSILRSINTDYLRERFLPQKQDELRIYAGEVIKLRRFIADIKKELEWRDESGYDVDCD